MAIFKEITDNKGITTRYHKIQQIQTDLRVMTVSVRSFVAADFRQQEQDREAQDEARAQREQEIEDLQNQITGLVEQNTDGSKTEEIRELSEQVNALVLADDIPQTTYTLGQHAAELEIQIPYFEPISLETLYQKLASTESPLSGGTEV